MSIPTQIVFRDNGTCLVFDRDNKRLQEYEGTTHADTMALLRLNGFDWTKLMRSGAPSSYPVRR